MDLLEAIDFNNNFEITQDEIDAVEVRLLGWSLGAVEAITVSRMLNDTSGRVGSFLFRLPYHLNAPIPVEDLILIDPVIDGLAPATFRIARPAENNVQNLVNYYQRRGGTSQMEFYFSGTYPLAYGHLGNYVYARSQIQGTGIDLRGNTIRSNAVSTAQIQIDNLGLFEVSYSWTHPQNNTVFDGAMAASQVHHSTIVWWVQGDVIYELA